MIFLSLFFSSCKRPKLVRRTINGYQVEQTTPKKTNNNSMITVWVHGTRLFKTITQPLDEYMHAAPPTGITPMTKLSHNHRLTRVAKTLVEADPHRFDFDSFYAFGWSGDLSFEEREKAASRLYEELKRLQKEAVGWHFWKRKPGIRLITHSHGANVALNIAAIKDPKDNFVIDEAIFLAGPVQEQTMQYTQDPCFKKIYSLYSTLDSIQVLDPQGLYKNGDAEKQRKIRFSSRRFSHHKKILQAKIKINGHGVPHVGFILQGFIKYLPSLINELESWEKTDPCKENEERLLILQTN